jgi:hypothetical protein
MPSAKIVAFTQAAAQIFPMSMDQPRYCINAVRIGIDALKEFGVTAKPMSVRVEYMNKIWYDFMLENDGWPKNDEQRDELIAKGGYCVGIDTKAPTTPDNWPGHLIMLAEAHIIDPSAIQFNRPAKGIDVPPVMMFNYPPGFEKGKRVAHFGNETGAACFYTARPNDRSFFQASGFQRHPGNQELTALTIAYMRKLLTEA